MICCEKCGSSVVTGSSGEYCPRCLLIGIGEEEVTALEDDEATHISGLSLDALALEELAEELPAFELQECIARGGMGVVWRAKERILDRQVAIKLLINPERKESFVHRFYREAKVMAALRHEYIVTLYSFGRTRSNHCYLVMELVEGGAFERKVAQQGLSLVESLSISQQLCTALSFAHSQGYIHRDIKPGNVLLDDRGSVKLADFGLARLGASAEDQITVNLTEIGSMVGTPQYMAPEQAKVGATVDQRADLYSLGVLLYQMVTGEVPRGVYVPPSQAVCLPEEVTLTKNTRRALALLDALLGHALQAKPELRLANVEAFSAELLKIRQLVDPALISEREKHRYETRWIVRKQLMLGTAVSLLLGLIIAWYARDYSAARSAETATLARQRHVFEIAPKDWGIQPGSSIKVKSASYLRPHDLHGTGGFGREMAVWKDWLVVTTAPSAQQVQPIAYLFKRKKGMWELAQTLSSPGKAVMQRLVPTVAMADGLLWVGLPSLHTQTGLEGQVYTYKLDASSNTWLPLSLPQPTNSRPNSRLIWGTALSASQQHLLGLAALRVTSSRVMDAQPMLFRLNDQRSAWDEVRLPGSPHVADSASLGAFDGHFLAQVFSRSAEAVKTSWIYSYDTGRNQAEDYTLPGELDSEIKSWSVSSSYIAAGFPDSDARNGVCYVLAKSAAARARELPLLHPPAEEQRTEFGKSVSLHGSYLAVSADHYEVDSLHVGAVFVYRVNNESPHYERQLAITAPARLLVSDFGQSVILTQDQLIVGAPASADISDQPTPAQGAVLVYDLAEPLK